MNTQGRKRGRDDQAYEFAHQHDQPGECEHLGNLRAFLADGNMEIWCRRKGKIYVQCWTCKKKTLVSLRSDDDLRRRKQ